MSAPERNADDVAADVYDFVADFMDDQDAGLVRPLREYLSRFPGSEDEVAAEYLRLSGHLGNAVALGSKTPEPAGTVDDQKGHVGRYRLLRLLGRGGQGEVWLAKDERLGREVALKLMSAIFVTEDRRARFRREAESIARLEHPGLAQVLEADVDGETPYIAMRYVAGVDLGTSFVHASAHAESAAAGVPAVEAVIPWVPQRRSDVLPVLRFFERCARALHAAHEAGVLHRDVKPGNIMVTPEGEPVLLDFGLARETIDQADSALTREGDVFGTLAYMAPEQLRGMVSEVDPRSDVWALGVTLFEALTGQRPFEGGGPGELAIAIDSGRVKDPHALNPTVTTDIRVVLETALERSRERRYASALALADDLRRICEFEPIQARPAGPALRMRRWCRREPAWAAALAVTLVALVGGLIASQAAVKRLREALDEVTAGKERLQLALDVVTAGRYCAEVPAFQAKAPAGALALGLEAVAMDDTWATRSSLYPPLLDLSLAQQLALPKERVWDTAFLDEETVVACGRDGALRVFDLSTGEIDASWDFGSDLRSLVVVAEASVLIVGASDGSVHALRANGLTPIWSATLGALPVVDLVLAGDVAVALVGDAEIVAIDVVAGEVLERVDAPTGGVGALRISLDGRRIVATGRAFHGARPTTSTEVLLLALPELETVARLEHPAALRDAVIDDTHRCVLTIDAEGGLHAFDLEAGQSIELSAADGGTATLGVSCASIAIAGNGSLIAVGTDAAADSRIVVQSLAGTAGRLSLVGAWSAPAAKRVVDLSFSPDGATLASASWDQRVRVFDSSSGAVLSEHVERNKPMAVVWSPAGRTLVSIGIWFTVEVWRTRPTDVAFRIPPLDGVGGALSAAVWGAFTADGERVLIRDERGRIAIFEAPSGLHTTTRVPGALVAKFDPVDGEPALLSAVALGAPVAAWFCRRGALRCVDTSTGETLWETRLPGWGGPPESVQECRSIAVSRDGSCVAVVDGAGRAWTWQPPSAPHEIDPAESSSSPGEPFEVVAFGPDLDVVYFADASAAVLQHHVDDTDASVWFERLPLARGPAVGIAVAPDGDEVVVASQRYELQCWDSATGRASRQPGGRINRRWVVYLRDGRILSAATGAETALVAGGGAEIKQSIAHDDDITACAVGPEALVFSTASIDGTVFVWDAASGEALARAEVHGGPVHSVAMAAGAEGVRVLSCGADGAAIWPVDVLAVARRLAPRGLSRFELRELEALVKED